MNLAKYTFGIFFSISMWTSCLVFENQSYANTESIPKDLKWLSNEEDLVYANTEAPKGGKLRLFIMSFPATLRVVGPDSNSGMRSYVLANQLGLTNRHPISDKIVPELATHWAFGADKKTMYFKINPQARWSDGKPVTADDFVYTLEFMRSPHIVAPWYNEHYTTFFDRVVKYDDYTIAVIAKKTEPDLDLLLSIGPTPKHYYHPLKADFVQKENWTTPPNTGPYQISKIEKGKAIVFQRKKDWWAKDFRYYKGRFNVDEISLKVVRDENAAWEGFLKGDFDYYPLVLPNLWYEKSKHPNFDKGYISKYFFYNEIPQSSQGVWINTKDPLLSDVNIRKALAHAMNFDRINKSLLRGDYVRLDQHFVGYGEYTNKKIKAPEFSLQKVDEFLKKSGWTQRGRDGIFEKNAKRLSFDLNYSQSIHTDRLVLLQEDAKKAGIELKLRLLDPTQAFKSVVEKKFQLSWSAWSTGLRPTYWEFYHSINADKVQTNNICNIADKTLDAKIDKHRNSVDEKEIIQLGHEIQKDLSEIGCFIPALSVPFFRAGLWRWFRFPKEFAQKKWPELLIPMGEDGASGGVMMGGLFWVDPVLQKQVEEARKSKQSLPVEFFEDIRFKR